MSKPRALAASATIVCGALLGMGAAFAPPSAASTGTTGTTATFAELPGATPNYIFPMMTGAYYSVANIEQFERLSYRSLYWVGDNGKPVIDPALSLAYPPTFSAGDTVVTVRLRDYRWSDGVPVSSRDVAFWVNLLKANKKDFAAYIPGEFPDNLKSYKLLGPEAVQFDLTGPVNPTWFTYDQLSQITPLPQQAWDKISASGPVANYDETRSGAVKVFDFFDQPVQGHIHLQHQPPLAGGGRPLEARRVPLGRVREVCRQPGLFRP